MNSLRFAFFLLACCLSASLLGQYADTWIFGNGAGLKFSGSGVASFPGGQINSPDNSTTISDINSNLLFYSNGINVWDKNNNVMPNGTGLIGNVTAGQCALIVPIPCQSNKYVIFHCTEFAAPGYLNYSVVDMSLNNGLGDVVANKKNVSLGSGWTEKMCAYYNVVGNYYWVFVHRWNSDQFVAFKVDQNSVATTSVVTSIGSVHSCGTYGGVHDAMGQLTISPDGTKMANVLTCSDKVELFDLNINAGTLSNSISLNGDGQYAWGTAFSPDSKKLYTNSIFGNKIYQFNISTYSQSQVALSQYTVASVTTSGYNFGYIELGPNGKIYVGRPGQTYLSVINAPNQSQSACGFTLTGQSLISGTSSHGTSRIAYNIPSTYVQVGISASSTSICAGQSVTLTATGAQNYSWSNSASGSSIIVYPTATTSYSVTGSTSAACGSNTSAVTVTVLPNSSPTVLAWVSPSITLCLGQPVVLRALGPGTFSWSNGATGPMVMITPQSNGTYTVWSSLPGTCGLGTATVNVLVKECVGLPKVTREKVSVFPNPSSEQITLTVPADLGRVHLLVTDLLGQILVDEEREVGTEFTISTTHLTPGLYSLIIHSSEKIFAAQFIME